MVDPKHVDSAPRTIRECAHQVQSTSGFQTFQLVCPIKSPDPQGIPDGTMVSGPKMVKRALQMYGSQWFWAQEVEFSLEVFDPNHQFQSQENRCRSANYTRIELPGSGNPLPSISWKKNGKVINPELTNPTSAKFTVEHVNAADSGIYSCRLENVHGSLDADFHVIVGDWTSEPAIDMHSGTFGASSAVIGISPPPAPVIDQPYNNTTVRVGHTAQFQCKVQWRKETPMIRWLRK
uniref:Ig-like domain-containing protein n=1 Tax=Ditylenchus dipsaci TaxID=166011 RepID=A0A915D1I0_9BILA